MNNNLIKEEEKELEIEKKKQEWARLMRLKFTEPDMLNPDGIKKWGEKEKKLLKKGIEKYGIGNWDKIREDGLKQWDSTELRIKTSALMGRQSLKQYKGWRGDEKAIQKEFERNYKIGKELNCWKGGVLVADDEGKVLKKIEETENK